MTAIAYIGFASSGYVGSYIPIVAEPEGTNHAAVWQPHPTTKIVSARSDRGPTSVCVGAWIVQPDRGGPPRHKHHAAAWQQHSQTSASIRPQATGVRVRAWIVQPDRGAVGRHEHHAAVWQQHPPMNLYGSIRLQAHWCVLVPDRTARIVVGCKARAPRGRLAAAPHLGTCLPRIRPCAAMYVLVLGLYSPIVAELKARTARGRPGAAPHR